MRRNLAQIQFCTVQSKIILRILIIMICISHVDSALAVERENKHVYHIGISSRSFGNVDINDAFAAMKAWTSTIKKEQNLDFGMEAKLLDKSTEEMRKIFIQGEYNGLSLSSPELVEMNIALPEYVILGERRNGIYLKYILITHSQSGIELPEDIQTCKLLTCDNNQMVMSLQWIESIFYEHSKKLKINPPISVKSFSKAILQVFFKQADAAIVTREAFDVVCELNPQLQKTLRVLYESPPLIPHFYLLPPASNSEKDISNMEKMLLDIDNTAGGRQVLTVFQSSKLVKYPATVLDDTIEFLKKHEQLIKTLNQ